MGRNARLDPTTLAHAIAPINDASRRFHYDFSMVLVRARTNFTWVIYKSAHFADVAWFRIILRRIDYWGQKTWRNRWHWHFLKTRIVDSGCCTSWWDWWQYRYRINDTLTAFFCTTLSCRSHKVWLKIRIFTRTWCLQWLLLEDSCWKVLFGHRHWLSALAYVAIVIDNVRVWDC